MLTLMYDTRGLKPSSKLLPHSFTFLNTVPFLPFRDIVIVSTVMIDYISFFNWNCVSSQSLVILSRYHLHYYGIFQAKENNGFYKPVCLLPTQIQAQNNLWLKILHVDHILIWYDTFERRKDSHNRFPAKFRVLNSSLN